MWVLPRISDNLVIANGRQPSQNSGVDAVPLQKYTPLRCRGIGRLKVEEKRSLHASAASMFACDARASRIGFFVPSTQSSAASKRGQSRLPAQCYSAQLIMTVKRTLTSQPVLSNGSSCFTERVMVEDEKHASGGRGENESRRAVAVTAQSAAPRQPPLRCRALCTRASPGSARSRRSLALICTMVSVFPPSCVALRISGPDLKSKLFAIPSFAMVRPHSRSLY